MAVLLLMLIGNKTEIAFAFPFVLALSRLNFWLQSNYFCILNDNRFNLWKLLNKLKFLRLEVIVDNRNNDNDSDFIKSLFLSICLCVLMDARIYAGSFLHFCFFFFSFFRYI